MTYQELQVELSARGFTYLSFTRLNQYINWARAELDDADAWEYRRTSQTGAAPLTIADLGWIQGVQHVSTKAQLQPIDRESLADRVDDLTVTGTPIYYYVDAGTVTTYPVATGSITVRYYKVPADMTDTAESPLAPSRFHKIIVDIAVRMAYRDADNHEAAEQLQAQIDRDLARMRLALMMTNTDGADGYIAEVEGW